MRRPWLRTGAAALLAAALLAGCAAIPGDGGVQPGRELALDPDPGVITQPDGPVAGAGPAQLVRGFLAAASSSQGDYAVAREFLTPAAAAAWQPGAGVSVVAAPPAPTEEGERVAVVAEAVARVDSAGGYHEPSAPEPLRLAFGLERVGEEWRIAETPDGIVLDRTTFDQVFAEFPVYFYDPAFRRLVPDLRWFPADSATATRVVRAVLSGPAAWLGDGVLLSAIPAGTELSVAAVTVAAGTARVDLTQLPASTRARGLVLAQLQASLVGVASIRQVVLSLEQEEQQVPAPEGVIRDRVLPRSPFVRIADAAGLLGGDGAITEQALGPALRLLGATAVDAELEQGRAAALGADGTWLVASASPVLVDPRPRQLAPALDGTAIWTADATGVLRSASVAGRERIELDWLEPAQRLRAIALAPDRTRVALAVHGPAGDRIAVAGVLRDERGQPVRLGPPLWLVPGQGELVDVAWAGATELVSIWRAGERSRVLQHQVGGRDQMLGEASARLLRVAAPGATAVVWARDDEGVLWELRNRTMTRLAEGVELLGTLR